MIIGGKIVQYVIHDEKIHTMMVRQLRDRLLACEPGLDPMAAESAAATAFEELRDELWDAADYRTLRDALCQTMADGDCWDGDGSQVEVLLRYVKHLAGGNHGNCVACDRIIEAGEVFEQVGMTGGMNPLPIICCMDCI